jgi:uncharacterized protein (DUF427 family)
MMSGMSSIRMRDAMADGLAGLRYEPTEKRVRAILGGQVVVDTTRAVLVWEPRRVVPSYAVPIGEMRAELTPAPPTAAPAEPAILHPGIAFAVHSADGQPLSVRAGEHSREAAAFQPADSALTGYVVLDFQAFDRWYEEDEALVGHPRDPYHRVDIRPSTRHVRIELDGQLLAESRRPTMVFETSLPPRFYLPPDDVHATLRPTEKKTYCAYKGEASYWSVDQADDIAWTYRQPLPEATRLTGLVAFFDDLVDVTVDGQPRQRPATAVAKAVLDEAGIRSRPAPA